MTTSHEIKLNRFNKHLQDTKAAVANYLASKPHVLTKQEDRERLTTTWTLTLVNAVPDEIGAMVGDALHNLRSVLDNWVYELSRGAGGKPVSKTGFPIFADEAEWNPGGCCRHDHGAHRVRKLPDALKAIVKTYQPFNMGDGRWDHIRDNLRTLHKLDIRDKHQALNLVAAHVDEGYWMQPEGGGHQIARYVLNGLLELDTPTTFLVLDFPTVQDFEMSVDPKPMLEVVLAEKETQRWEAGWEVVSCLEALWHSVGWILGQARQPPVVPGEPST